MSSALKIKNTTPNSLQEFNILLNDYDYSIFRIEDTLVQDNIGTGTISINPANTTGLTLIGTFIDTYIPGGAGQHPVGTTPINVTYNLYQNLNNVSETSVVFPVEFSSGAIREQNTSSLNNDTILSTLQHITQYQGVGTYVLQPSAPVGGTWISIGQLINNLDNFNSNSTTLWKKIAPANIPTNISRPIKFLNNSLIEFSDSDINNLSLRVRNQIINSGIGQYRLSTTIPLGGTWIISGSAFFDTSRTTSNISYSGTYTGPYTGTYAGTYTGFYTGFYAANYTGFYTGTYTNIQPYTGAILGYFTGFYTGFYAGTRAHTNQHSFTGYYTGTYTGSYTGFYTGTTLNSDSSNISSVSLWVRIA